MRKILILFAHPKYEFSVANRAMLQGIGDLPFITINDLYEKYPAFNIDVQAEQALLAQHDVIIWQHPIHWYAAPPIMQQWMALVLTHGWAYGMGGEALKNKYIFNAVTTSGSREAYSETGLHARALAHYLLPYQQTAVLCNMHYLPHFQLEESQHLPPEKLRANVENYRKLLQYVSRPDADFSKLAMVNDLGDLNIDAL